MTFDEQVLRNIVRKSIQRGKLFELIFSKNGRRIWL